MKLTQALKAWAVKHCGLADTASDDDFRKAVAEAMLKGEGDEGHLSHEQYVELTADPDANKATEFEAKIDAVLNGQRTINDRLSVLETPPESPPVPEAPEAKTVEEEEVKPREPSGLEKAFSASLGSSSNDVSIRQVDAIEQYDGTKTAMRFPDFDEKGRPHRLAGQQVTEGDKTSGVRSIDRPSERDLAVCGAFFKFLCQSQNPRLPRQLRMTDHDKDLLYWGLHNLKWGGVIHGDCTSVDGSIGVRDRKLSEHEIKGILDDATSGGIEVAPIVFDDAIIETPYLTGELFPLITVVPITRGRRIEGASIGQVTLTSGGADNTEIALFNTSSFIAAFDTNIFVVNGAIEIGLDFLSDSVPDIGGMVTRQYGQKLLEWLDEQIAIGDGTTEPEGITVASGTVSVSSANGNTGPPTVGDYEGLLFGVAKKYKKGFSANRIVYGASETTYQRARGIAVGTSDARRVFGMDHESYSLLNHPYKINDQIANTKCFFGVMPRYRMYRRLGLVTRTSTDGDYLMRRNLMLLVARARFGGQIEDGNAFAVMTDCQT